MTRWSPSAAVSRPEGTGIEPDRGGEVNIFIQHLRGETFSEGEFGDLSAEFFRDFKGKFCQPDHEFESYPLRQMTRLRNVFS
jgi:hypothetical protein